MPKFDADSIDGDLEYDFSKWGGPSGTVPEPPQHAVRGLMKRISRVFKDSGLRKEDEEDNITPGEVAETMDRVEDDEMFEKLNIELLDALAMVCGGSPSKEELEKLPYRPFMGFFGYLIGNLTNPEGSTSGTTNSRKRLRSV
jgi:hypothetical protein